MFLTWLDADPTNRYDATVVAWGKVTPLLRAPLINVMSVWCRFPGYPLAIVTDHHLSMTAVSLMISACLTTRRIITVSAPRSRSAADHASMVGPWISHPLISFPVAHHEIEDDPR